MKSRSFISLAFLTGLFSHSATAEGFLDERWRYGGRELRINLVDCQSIIDRPLPPRTRKVIITARIRCGRDADGNPRFLIKLRSSRGYILEVSANTFAFVNHADQRTAIQIGTIEVDAPNAQTLKLINILKVYAR